MKPHSEINVAYVIIGDDTQQRRGLYVDGELMSAGIDAIRGMMRASIDFGWDGVYERLWMIRQDVVPFCEEHSDMPATLDELLQNWRLETLFRNFPGELD